MKPGFDGVEMHCTNGYLLAEFLQRLTNKCTGKYGGSFENCARIVLEIVEAVSTVFPSSRVGVCCPLNGGFGSMGSEDNVEMYTYLREKLSTYGLGYLAILDDFGFDYHNKCRVVTAFDAKKAFKGTVIANCSCTSDIDDHEVALRSLASEKFHRSSASAGTPSLLTV